jgi:hypothetical protein
MNIALRLRGHEAQLDSVIWASSTRALLKQKKPAGGKDQGIVRFTQIARFRDCRVSAET